MDVQPDEGRSLAEIAAFLRRLQFIAVAALAVWLVWLLSPILTPFVLGAILGWLGDPLVDRLERSGRSRSTAVLMVYSLMLLILALAVVLLVPVIQEQIITLIDSLPQYQNWLIATALPWLERTSGLELLAWLDTDRIVPWIREHWQQAGGIATTLLGYVSRSGFALLTWVLNLVLVPIVAYFFLRDWDVFVERAAALVPRSYLPTVSRLARESDEVLGGFLRGQFLVMIGMGVFYAVGLQLVGLDLGILIGILGGIFTFVPYVGPTVIILFGSLAALMQYGDWQHLLGVAVVWGLGQMLESYVLTPKLVGERIGLHPLAVIFAVMAGGVLFGFVGMLIALPVAAVANVLMHFAMERYQTSKVYAGDAVNAPVPAGSLASGQPKP